MLTPLLFFISMVVIPYWASSLLLFLSPNPGVCFKTWVLIRAGESELKSRSRGIFGASGVGVGKNWPTPTSTPETPKM